MAVFCLLTFLGLDPIDESQQVLLYLYVLLVYRKCWCGRVVLDPHSGGVEFFINPFSTQYHQVASSDIVLS